MASLSVCTIDLKRKPQYPLKPPRRKDVTVCIAAICEHGSAIVSVCDAKISVGHASSDRTALKNYRLSQGWNMMYSGSDVSQ